MTMMMVLSPPFNKMYEFLLVPTKCTPYGSCVLLYAVLNHRPDLILAGSVQMNPPSFPPHPVSVHVSEYHNFAASLTLAVN